MKRLSIVLAAFAFAAVLFHSGHAPAGAQTAPTAPPPPPPPNATPTPALPPGALPTVAPQSATVALPEHHHGKATPAPPKDPDANRVGISGVWEVALQQSSGVSYTHFKLAQSGNILTGTYLDSNNKRYPISGSVDGKTVRLVVSLPNGSDLVFNGEQDANTDMVGTLDGSNSTIGFTAAYRPKYKWTDSINPSGMGGMGGMGGGPGGGMGTPY